MSIQTIDAETYARERAICDTAHAYAERVMCGDGRKRRRNYLTAEEAAHPSYASCDNAMRGRVEQYELLHNPPDRFGAYLSTRPDGRFVVTVWTGDAIGTADIVSNWRVNSAYGSRMYAVRARVGGREYVGRGFGGGMFIGLRAVKRA